MPDKPLSNPSKLILGLPAAKVHVSWMPVGEQDIGRSKVAPTPALLTGDSSSNGSINNKSNARILNDKNSSAFAATDEDDTKHRTPGQAVERNKLSARSQFSPALDAEIWQFASYVSLSEQEMQCRRVVLEDVREALQAKFPNAAVNAFGSFASAMSIFSSDVDVSVEGLGAEIDEEGQFCLQGIAREENDKENNTNDEDKEGEERDGDRDGKEERGRTAAMSAGHKRKALAMYEESAAAALEEEETVTVGWLLDTSGDKPQPPANISAFPAASLGGRDTFTSAESIGILARGQVVELNSTSSAEIVLQEREWHNQTNNDHHTLRSNLSRKITNALLEMNPLAPRAWYQDLRKLVADTENNLFHAAISCEEYSDQSTLKQRIQFLMERGVVWHNSALTPTANETRSGEQAGNARNVREVLLENIGRNLVRLRRYERQSDADVSEEGSISSLQQLDADVRSFLEENDTLLREVEACRAMDRRLQDLVAAKIRSQGDDISAGIQARGSSPETASSVISSPAITASTRSGVVVIDTGLTTIKSRSIADKNNSLYQTLYNSEISPPSDHSGSNDSSDSSVSGSDNSEYEEEVMQKSRKRGSSEGENMDGIEDEDYDDDEEGDDRSDDDDSDSRDSWSGGPKDDTYAYSDDDDDLDIGIHGAEHFSDDDIRGSTSSQFAMQLHAQQRATDKKQLLERRRHQQETLRAIYAHLQRMGWNEVCELRSRARVPIIALLHRSGINCDISLGVQGGSLTTVVRDLISAGRDAFYPLTAFLKVFLGQLNLDKPFNGGIGSYKLYVMVAYLLNCFQSQTLCKPRVDLGYLLVAFLTYFGKQENLNQYTELKVFGAAVDFRHNGLVVACQKAFQKACDILKKAVVSPAQFTSAKERQKMSSSLLALIIDSQKLQKSRSQYTESTTAALLQRPPDREARERVATEILGVLCRKLSGGGVVPKITLEQVKETNSALAARLMSFLSVRDAVSHLAGGVAESGANHIFATKAKGKAKSGGIARYESGRPHLHARPSKRARVHGYSDESSGARNRNRGSGGDGSGGVQGRKGMAHFAPMGVTGAAIKATLPRSVNIATPEGARKERELRAVLLAAKARGVSAKKY